MSPTSYQTAPPRVGVGQVSYRTSAPGHNVVPMPLFRRRRPPDPRVIQLMRQVEALRTRLAELEERSERAEGRVQEVSTALTDQLHELSADLEGGHRGIDERLAALDALI